MREHLFFARPSRGTPRPPLGTQHKIRLTGIDAPEKKQAFGQRSKESLSDLVYSREVAVETTKVDRYGRELGKVVVNGVDANLEQIRRGLAWHYKAYQRDQSAADRAAYSEAEEWAREGRRGLWGDAHPMPPWEFRQSAGSPSGLHGASAGN